MDPSEALISVFCSLQDQDAIASHGIPVLLSFRWYSLTDPRGMARRRRVGVGTQQPRARFKPISRSPVQYSATRPLSTYHYDIISESCRLSFNLGIF